MELRVEVVAETRHDHVALPGLQCRREPRSRRRHPDDAEPQPARYPFQQLDLEAGLPAGLREGERRAVEIDARPQAVLLGELCRGDRPDDRLGLAACARVLPGATASEERGGEGGGCEEGELHRLKPAQTYARARAGPG